jgi:hypothetical protein
MQYIPVLERLCEPERQIMFRWAACTVSVADTQRCVSLRLCCTMFNLLGTEPVGIDGY